MGTRGLVLALAGLSALDPGAQGSSPEPPRALLPKRHGPLLRHGAGGGAGGNGTGVAPPEDEHAAVQEGVALLVILLGLFFIIACCYCGEQKLNENNEGYAAKKVSHRRNSMRLSMIDMPQSYSDRKLILSPGFEGLDPTQTRRVPYQKLSEPVPREETELSESLGILSSSASPSKHRRRMSSASESLGRRTSSASESLRTLSPSASPNHQLGSVATQAGIVARPARSASPPQEGEGTTDVSCIPACCGTFRTPRNETSSEQ